MASFMTTLPLELGLGLGLLPCLRGRSLLLSLRVEVCLSVSSLSVFHGAYKHTDLQRQKSLFRDQLPLLVGQNCHAEVFQAVANRALASRLTLAEAKRSRGLHGLTRLDENLAGAFRVPSG